MKKLEVMAVRVYLTEGESQLNKLLRKLRVEEKVRGVTVFRGVSGFGPSGAVHVSSITDLSLDLPLVVEFFDLPNKVETILDHISAQYAPGHILTWQAFMNVEEENK